MIAATRPASARRWRLWPSSWLGDRTTPALLTAKARQLAAAEKQRPLDAYRAAELAIMDRNFSDPSEPYARLRRAFVYKEKPSHTPLHLARHRTQSQPTRPTYHARPLAAAS